MNKKSLIVSIMLAALGIASGSAHAIPIVIEFTGIAEHTTNVTWVSRDPLSGDFSWDDSLLGQAVTGRITVETEGLSQSTSSTPGYSNLFYHNASLDPLRLITSELTIGGLDYSMGEYPFQSGNIGMQDALSPDISDIFFISHSYSQRPSRTLEDGQAASSSLLLQWHDQDDLLSLSELSQGLDPDRIVPVLNSLRITAQLITAINSCIDGACKNTSQSFTIFNITSFQAHAHSVPEPGTLGLFAAGLLGVGLARRRQQRGV